MAPLNTFTCPLALAPVMMSSNPSPSMSPKATPWPFCRWPVPDAAVTSRKRRPPSFLNMKFGTSAAYEGAPVPM